MLNRGPDQSNPKTSDPAMSGGAGLVLIGALILLLDAFGRELLILSWLGSLQTPIGWALVAVGLAIIIIRRIQGVPLSSMMSSASRGAAKTAAAAEKPAAAKEPDPPQT